MAITTMEDLRQVLKDVPALNDVVSFIESQVQAEKTRGIEAHRKANNEAQSLRKWKTVLEGLGYQGEPDGVDEWLAEKAKTTPEGAPRKGGPDPEIEKLRREFKAAQQALEQEKANAAKIKAASDRRQIKAKLGEALRERVYGYDLLADSLISEGRVKLTEDEQVVFVKGDEEVGFEQGVKAILETRPDLVRNTQAPGARSGSRPGTAAPVYTIDSLKNMTQAEIAANMKDIMASLRAQKA